jgi:hypothetical protein
MNHINKIETLIRETRALEQRYKDLFDEVADDFGSSAKLSRALDMSLSYIANAISQKNGLIALEKVARRIRDLLKKKESDAA